MAHGIFTRDLPVACFMNGFMTCLSLKSILAHMSRDMRKPALCFLTRSNTIRAVQPKKIGSFGFWSRNFLPFLFDF